MSFQSDVILNRWWVSETEKDGQLVVNDSLTELIVLLTRPSS